MQKNIEQAVRLTFSLPNSLNIELDNLKKETKISKSEIINLAIKEYIKKVQQKKIQQAVKLMEDEYKHNKTLTEFTAIDKDDFL